jgi:Rod binding domain-containing protein
MSSSSTNISLATIGSDAGIPNLNVASIPENIRNGDSKAKQAYSEGLAFEDMLVNELTQQLASTMYGGDSSDGSSSADGSSTDGSSGSSSGMLGGASAYASMIPQALSSSIMDSGGLGMAESFAQELDPSLLSQAAGASTAGATTAASSVAAGADTSSSTTDESSGASVGAARQVTV